MEPRHWDTDGAAEVEKSLLRAGREDGPRAGADLAIIAALSAPRPPAAESVSLVRFAKVGIVAVVVGGGSVVAHQLLRPAQRVAVRASMTYQAGADPLAPAPMPTASPTPEPETLQVPPDRPRPRRWPSKPLRSLSTTDHSLGEETKALDLARQALDVKDPAQALRLLDDYGRRFPRGLLRPEGMVLRVAALVQDGRHSAANSLAHQLLADRDYQPYVARIQSLLREAKP